MKYLRAIYTLLFIGVVAVFFTQPTKYMQSFVNGVTVWAYNVLPALFPFMVLTTFALKVAPTSRHSFTKLLFGISCDNVFFMSLLCGYPVGAKAIADTEADVQTATKMCSFCSSTGPIFMAATVGAKLLQNVTATIILIFTHFVALLLNGLAYRNRQKTIEVLDSSPKLRAEDFGNTITNSVLSVISVGGLIALFYMLADMIKGLLPSAWSNSLTLSFAIGLLEMTNGILGVCKLTDTATATVLCSALLALGGMCVFLQCYAFLGKKNIKAVDVIKMKLTQTAFATILSFILVKIFL